MAASAFARTYRPVAERDAGGSYPYLRSVLAPEYAALPTPQLEAFMESEYGEGAAEQYDEYLEGFFSDIGNFVKKAAPVVANIGGGVIKGASTGAALGLPGIIGGAVAGGVGQGFASYGSGSLRKVGQGINTGMNLAGQFSPTGRIGGAVGGALSSIGQGKNVVQTALNTGMGLAGGPLGKMAGLAGGSGGALGSLAGLLGGAGGGNAASQVLSLLRQPAVLQSLGAMAMGPAGRPSVPIGATQTPVPTSAIADLLRQQLNRAVDEQAELADGSESEMAYLTDSDGEWLVDPAESDQRSSVLLWLLAADELNRLARTQTRETPEPEPARWERQQARETAMYDAMDLAEAYALESEWDEYDEWDESDEAWEWDEYEEEE